MLNQVFACIMFIKNGGQVQCNPEEASVWLWIRDSKEVV
jgi:hypothetical protein